MKKNTFVIAIYATLILVGGIMGYLKANSQVSLIASSILALLLLACSYLISKGYPIAMNIVLGMQGLILLFFGYRFFSSFAFMPAGMMTLITLLTMGYLIFQKKQSGNSGKAPAKTTHL